MEFKAETFFTYTNDAGERSRWKILKEWYNDDLEFRALAETVKCKNPEGIGYQSIFKASEIEYDPACIPSVWVID